MTLRSHARGPAFAAVGAAVLLATTLIAPALGSSSNTYSGQATVVRTTVLGASIVLADTGPLPSNGGSRDATLFTASVPGLLTADLLDATTVGDGDISHSHASVADVDLTVASQRIGATLLAADATASCSGGSPSTTGTSDVLGLTVNGQTITVTGKPNQTETLPGLTVIVNEQRSNGPGDITVNALHIIAPGIADVVISSAHADITCGSPPPPPPCTNPPSDFVTGGGWITGTPSGAKGNFGVAGGFRNGSLWGHLTYDDHGPSGPRVRATSVDDYAFVNEVTRRISGQAEVNGMPGYSYTVTVADNGEPGSADSFALKLSNGYAASGTLSGGNIQLHKPNPCQ